MLPELTFKKSASGFERGSYFNVKLREFYKLNEGVKEPLSKYNIETLRLIREAKQALNIQRIKFGMFFYMVITTKEYQSIGYVRNIHHSVKEQTKLITNLDQILLRVKIDKAWADAIKTYMYDGIMERCARLEKMILPDLIKSSKIGIYEYYLQTQGITLDEDILQHVGNGDDVYYSYVLTKIEECEKTMPKEKLEELSQIREKIIEHHNEAKEKAVKEKQERKEKIREDFQKDAFVMLQNWASKVVANEQSSDGMRKTMLYTRAFNIMEKFNDKLTREMQTFKLIAVARYNTKNRISVSSFRWLNINDKKNDYTLCCSFGYAYPFFPSLDKETYAKAIEYCESKGFIVAVVDCEITGKKLPEINLVDYDYYQELPMITWSKTRSFTDLSEDEKDILIRTRLHRSLNTLKCALIIREAYEIYEPTHATTGLLDVKKIKLYWMELYETYFNQKEDKWLLNSKNESDCRNYRSRLASVAKSTAGKIAECFDFALTSDNDEWINAIKSIINFNSYAEEDLKKVYDVLKACEQKFPMPEEFYIVGPFNNRMRREVKHYQKTNTGFVVSEDIWDEKSVIYRRWGYDAVSKRDYAAYYLEEHDSPLNIVINKIA